MDYIWSDRKRTLFGLPLSFTKYRLTEDRLFIEKGFLSKNEDEVRLYRILDLSLNRSLGQRDLKHVTNREFMAYDDEEEV